MKSNIIYGLLDPITLEIRYIGQSRVGISRPKSHMQPSSLKLYKTNKNLNKKQAWIKSLLIKGLKPKIIILEEFDSPEYLNEAEEFWIIYFKYIGANLTNGIFLSVDQYLHVPWNKGTKGDPRSKGGTKKGNIPWNKGLVSKPKKEKSNEKYTVWNKGKSFKSLGICNVCRELKSPEEFSTRGSKCKNCAAKAARLYRKRKKEAKE